MLYLAFILGLMGSLHCVGMCGAIVLVLPIEQKSHFITKYFQLFLYFFGKIIAYITLGIVFGIVGKGLFISHYQQEFSILIGVVMLVMGLLSVFHLHFNFLKKTFFFEFHKVKILLGKQFQKRNFFTPFLIGFFNGFLPCGLVYTALFSALTNTQLTDIVLYMFFFGLGTIPLMLLIYFIKNLLTPTLRKYIQKLIPFTIALIGILFIMRGLGLNIPFLSPANNSLMIQNFPECIIPMPMP